MTFYHNGEFILVKTDPERAEQAVRILRVQRHARESARSVSALSSAYYEFRVAVLGLYKAVLALGLVYLVFALWPESVTDESSGSRWSNVIKIGSWSQHISDDARLILIVLCTGAF